jgi:hypothetical protein
MKKLLLELEKKDLVVSIKKNSNGLDYSKRIKWRLADKVYNVYKGVQLKPEDII